MVILEALLPINVFLMFPLRSKTLINSMDLDLEVVLDASVISTCAVDGTGFGATSILLPDPQSSGV